MRLAIRVLWTLGLALASLIATVLITKDLVPALLVALAVILAMAVVLTAWDWWRGRQAKGKVQTNTSVSPPQSTTAVPAPRVYVDVTPEDLGALFMNRSPIQTQIALQPYMGNWMTVAGPLGGIHPAGTATIYQSRIAEVTFADRGPGLPKLTVNAYFRGADWMERLGDLTLGQQITVAGQIVAVLSTIVSLDYCELVDEGKAQD